MLSYPDRFRFKSAPPRASRVMFVWFVFLLWWPSSRSACWSPPSYKRQRLTVPGVYSSNPLRCCEAKEMPQMRGRRLKNTAGVAYYTRPP
jgi:hypothetical protein